MSWLVLFVFMVMSTVLVLVVDEILYRTGRTTITSWVRHSHWIWGVLAVVWQFVSGFALWMHFIS